ncbi:MAG: site-specific integrase, partial [Acidobacteriota bacterium]|nr:site-specific integrase [Acidobacteriota bacterium]
TITIKNTQKKKTLPKEGKDLRNEIMGIEFALKRESSPMLEERLEQAKEQLRKIEYIQPASRYRIIPIVPELANHIAKHCADKRIKKNDRMFSFSGVRAYLVIREAAEKAGIGEGKRHPSAFRHGFAVNATLAGMPPFVLNNWLGHTNIVSTLLYTAVLPQDARGYLGKMKL